MPGFNPESGRLLSIRSEKLPKGGKPVTLADVVDYSFLDKARKEWESQNSFELRDSKLSI